jgi:hypothetical protein
LQDKPFYIKTSKHIPEAIMQLNMLLILVSFTAFFHTSLCLGRPDSSPVNSTITLHNSTSIRPRQAPEIKVLKQVYICSGQLNGSPNYDCPSQTCTGWNNWLDTEPVLVQAPHTNCIDTDCDTNFKVCNKHSGAEQQCYETEAFTPSIDAEGRCCYSVPGTEHVYLWA